MFGSLGSLGVQGRPGAVSVICMAERGAMFDPGPCLYMDKLAVGPDVDPAVVSLNQPVAENLRQVAACLDKPIRSGGLNDKNIIELGLS